MKKYNFTKILSEYNKKYGHNYVLETGIVNPTVEPYGGDFLIKYHSMFGDKSEYITDFVNLHIIPRYSLEISLIKALIQSKETDKLNIEIKILPSNKIRYAYLHNNYFQLTGTLGNSCMRHKENQKSLNFYVKNGVKIVVAIDSNNKIYARSLLWDGVKSTKHKTPFTYLDRVYYSTEHFIELFRKLAVTNKWEHFHSKSAKQIKGTYYIDTVDITGIYHLPYTDTFKYLYYKDNFLASSTPSSLASKLKHAGCLILLTHQHNGGYAPQLDPDRVQEALTNNYISKKDATFIKRYKGWILKKNIADINGDYYSLHDNKVTKSELDGFILTENSVEEAITCDKIDKAKAIHIPKYNGYVHKSHIIYIRGNGYHIKDMDIICIDKKYYHVSQCFINYDREAVNKELTKQGVLSYYHTFFEWRGKSYSCISQCTVTRKGDLIPKEHAIIAYNLVYSPVLNDLEYQEVYLPKNCKKIEYIILNTGTYIVNSSENRQHLKKFNHKYYIKQDFKLPDKKQLLLFK